MDSEDDGAQIIICTLFYEAIKVDCIQLKSTVLCWVRQTLNK